MNMAFDNLDNMIEEMSAANERKKQNRTWVRRMKFKWTKRQILLLISHVEIRKLLWDHTDLDYKNIKLRDVLWNEVAQSLMIDKNDVVYKWNRVRNTFRRTYINLKNSGNRDASQKDSYRGVYQFLLFLEPTLQFKAKNQPFHVSKTMRSMSSSTIDAEEGRSDIDEDDVVMSSPLPSQSSVSKLQRVKVIEQTDIGGKELSKDSTKTNDTWSEISRFITMNGRRWSRINRRLEAKFRSSLYKLVSDTELEAVTGNCN